MQTPEEILSQFPDHEEMYDDEIYYRFDYIMKAMEIWGKQCFEAGREGMEESSFELPWTSYEDYLKSLEDGTD